MLPSKNKVVVLILLLLTIIIVAACQSPRPQSSTQASAQVNQTLPSTAQPVPTATSVTRPTPVDVVAPSQFELVGALGGVMRTVFVQGEYAFIGVGLQLIVVDVSNPANPSPVGSLLLPQGLADIYADGDTAYVAHAGGVSIINITDPTAPSVAGVYALPGSAVSVAGVSNVDHIYVAYHQGFDNEGRNLGGGLIVMDTSTPTHPVEVGNYQTPATIHDLAVALTAGRLYAYLAEEGECRRADSSWVDFICQGQVRILDLSEPRGPVEVAVYKTNMPARQIEVRDDRVYIAECEPAQSCQRVVLDVSDPAQPREIGSFQPVAPGPTGIDSYEPPGPTSAGAVKAAGNYIYATDDIRRGLAVIDVANPAAPVEVGFVAAEPPGKIWGIYPPYLYLGDEWLGLHIVDISTPTAPVVVANYRPPDGQRVLAVDAGLAYVTTPQGWQIIDLSNPAAPREVGTYQTDGPENSLFGATVQAGWLYAAAYEDGWQVIDWTDPVVPVEQGFVALPTGPPPVMADDYAYFSLTDGTQIFDLSNPAAPVKLGSYQAPGTVAVGYGLAVGVVDLKASLIDVSNPSAPLELGIYEGLQPVEAAALAPGPDGQLYAYLYSPAGRVDVVDVSTPARPLRLGSHTLSQADWLPVSDIVVAGQYAYLSGPAVVVMVDISNPTGPFEAGRYPIEGRMQVVQVVAGVVYAYILDFDNTLRLVDLSNPAAPQEVGLYNAPQNIVALAASGNALYLSLEGGLDKQVIQRLDISNPAAPQETGRYETGLLSGRMMVVGDVLYLQAGRQVARVVDVSDPTRPVAAGYVAIPSAAGIEQLFAAANQLYLVVQQSGGPNSEPTWELQVIDASNPAAPVVRGSFRPELPAQSGVLAAGDGYLYFVDRRGQLRLADLSNPASPRDMGTVLKFDPAGYLQAMDISGDKLYLGLGDLGVAIFKRS